MAIVTDRRNLELTGSLVCRCELIHYPSSPFGKSLEASMSFLITLTLFFAEPAAADSSPPRAVTAPVAEKAISDPDWDAAFTRNTGWTGSDLAGSIDLGDGRTLWVFGDTWIGDVVKGKHAPGSRMVNNTIAVHPSPSETMHTAPKPDDVRFHWGPNDSQGYPTAWIVPTTSTGDAKPGESNADWFWPTGGGVVLPAADGTSKLVLLLHRVRKADRPGTIWNFQVVGTTMAIIDRPDEPVEKWQPRQLDIPETSARDNSSLQADRPEIRWGMAACIDPEEPPAGNRHVYIFGTRRYDTIGLSLLIARVECDGIKEFSKWRFFAGNDRWSERVDDAAPIADSLVSEFSIDRVQLDGPARWVIIQSEQLFGRRILARTAPRPAGPWSKPIPIHTVAELADRKSLFTYAAKGHATLSRPGELLVTYIINSHKFGEIVNDATLYRPRFIRMPLKRLSK